jgi:hypothetical protein
MKPTKQSMSFLFDGISSAKLALDKRGYKATTIVQK